MTVIHYAVIEELQRQWVFHTQQFPVFIKNGPPPKGVNMGQHWSQHGPAFLWNSFDTL
jgi:hypothetical protein